MHGFDGLTSRDIAAAAGVSTGLLHHYFPSMSAALEAAFQHAAQEELDTLTAALTAEPDVLRRLDRLISLYIDDGAMMELWIDAWGASCRYPRIRATTARLTTAWVDALEQILSDGVADGTFDCVDTKASAWRLTMLLDGLAVEVVAVRTISRRRARELVDIAVAHEVGFPFKSFSCGRKARSGRSNGGRKSPDAS